MVFNHYLHHWLIPFHFFILPSISPTFPAFPSRKLSIRMSAKGQSFGVSRFFFSSGSCQLVLAAAHFDFWEVQGISNTPRIISALEKSHEMVFNLALCYLGFPNLSYFSLFCSIFLSFPSKGVSMGIIRLLIFLNTISNFWASWVVLAAANFGFWGAQGISNTPRIIFALGK